MTRIQPTNTAKLLSEIQNFTARKSKLVAKQHGRGPYNAHLHNIRFQTQ
jgi:hypothetical protein